MRDGLHAVMPHLDRYEFKKIFGRPPRMTGSLDCAEAALARLRGCDVQEFTCIGDDIRSYVITRDPRAIATNKEE